MEIYSNIKDGYIYPIWYNNIQDCLNNTNINKFTNGYLYILNIDNNYIKIGKSNNIKKRLKDHHRKLNNKIKTVGIIGNIKYISIIENILHSNLYNLPNWIIERSKETYDSETYKINNKIKECYTFIDFIEIVLILFQQKFKYNWNNFLGENEKYGFNIFNPDENNEGFNKFIKQYSMN